MRNLLPGSLVLALFIAGGMTVSAQQQTPTPVEVDCPAGLDCVDYGSDVTFSLDPDDGKTQGVVVEQLVKVAVFVDSGDGFVLVGETIEPADGDYEDAAFGDLYVFAEREQ